LEHQNGGTQAGAPFAYISEFIEQAKASSIVQRVIDRVDELG
jgi:hypothetical protein